MTESLSAWKETERNVVLFPSLCSYVFTFILSILVRTSARKVLQNEVELTDKL